MKEMRESHEFPSPGKSDRWAAPNPAGAHRLLSQPDPSHPALSPLKGSLNRLGGLGLAGRLWKWETCPESPALCPIPRLSLLISLTA